MLTDLSSIQRWMQAAITQPEGLGAGPPDALDQFIAPSSRLSARQRLGLYYRGYFARLLDCFSGQFKVLRHALGADLFLDFAREYLQQHPSQSYTLAELGTRFPDFLATTRPDRDLPPAEREAWPDFMIDLARLEHAAFTAFDGPGAEAGGLATPATPDHALRLAPSLALMHFQFPVNSYYQAVYRGDDPSLPPTQPSYLAITRVNYQLGMFDLKPVQYQLLAQLQQGQSLPEALHGLASQPGLTPASAVGLWQEWRHKWLEAGFFVAAA
jgi:hypothetical protein